MYSTVKLRILPSHAQSVSGGGGVEPQVVLAPVVTSTKMVSELSPTSTSMEPEQPCASVTVTW